MHSNLKITRVILSKRAKIISNKKYFSLIMKIYNVATINRLIKEKLLNECSHCTCKYFDKDCKLKQCFNYQRYELIEKSCKYEQRCAICANSHNDNTCTTSIKRRKYVNCDENHFVWLFQCKIKIEKKNKLNDIILQINFAFRKKHKTCQENSWENDNANARAHTSHCIDVRSLL
jgi:uncharacterized protein YbcC (UPF0753/DUF2309 family)